VLVEPLAGWRHVCVTERRTKQDYAAVLRYLVEERFPEAECICVVQDNLNTHTAGALYETFAPEQARHILASLEFHYTPKHGSWLNQAEIEISVFERGCLSRPVPDTATLQQRVQALEAERNERRATIDWQFTSQQARLKLKKLYSCQNPTGLSTSGSLALSDAIFAPEKETRDISSGTGQRMAAFPRPHASGGALPAPNERGRIGIPPPCSCLQPVDDLQRSLGVLPRQRAVSQDALD
jgi:hypothetical protein